MRLKTKQEAEIIKLKKMAARALLNFQAVAEGYDCGNALLKEISGDAAAFAGRYNAAMTQLAEIDPDFPKNWTPL